MTESAVDSSGRQFTRVRVLGKVRDIMDLFSLEQPVLDLKQLREATGLPASTLSRLVRNMVNDGLLQERAGEFRIGIAVLRWAAVASQGLNVIDIITPFLEGLRDATNETVAYFVRDGRYRVCVALAETRQPIGRRLTIGHVLPAHVGSPGKVLLAFDPEAINDVDLTGLERMTERTITDRDALMAELAHVRHDGYAASSGEWSSEVAGIAVPVVGLNNRLVGAIAISAPTTRMTKSSQREWLLALRATAAEVSAQLGGAQP